MSGIYIHIPFCNKRCNYCNFYFSTNKKIIPDFITSLKKEIKLTSDKFSHLKFNTVYFGGGTPSLIADSDLKNILTELRNNLKISNDSEISIEVNPEDLNEDKLKFYKNSGINRLSIGVQSLKNQELIFLSRQHLSEVTIEKLKLVKKYFDNFSVDLIYSLPGQSFDDIKFTLDIYNELNAPHISAYTLTIEEKTLLYKNLQDKLFTKNSSEKEADLFLELSEYLKSSGYLHYEVSSFSLPGYESKHNSKYWNYEDYIGLGPSAHSLHHNTRWNNFSSLGKYNLFLNDNKLPVENIINLSKEELKFEFLTLSLRHNGINFKKYESLFREDFKKVYSDVIKILKNNEFAVENENSFKLTDKGYLLADEICSRYF
ncbi:MAG: radical SAM family heme chaperone HemW [Ignavibacteria bacterium]|nr:radical SAM family heme chaperone HemW [Ignavibacteria bacterium]